ncbi:MAG: hypothetical protein Q4G04_01615 [bacterium]|nr:hypothetical protein [bacterium]
MEKNEDLEKIIKGGDNIIKPMLGDEMLKSDDKFVSQSGISKGFGMSEPDILVKTLDIYKSESEIHPNIFEPKPDIYKSESEVHPDIFEPKPVIYEDVEVTEGYSINEFGEIIRTESESKGRSK